jgi:hypothetical protein
MADEANKWLDTLVDLLDKYNGGDHKSIEVGLRLK